MIGTDPKGKGGIASVVSVLIAENFFHNHAIKYVSSHRDGSGLKKLLLSIFAGFKVAAYCAFLRPRIVHVHSSSYGSFIRKSIYLAIARATGCITIFQLHSGAFEKFATREAGHILRKWIRHTLNKSHQVLVLSDDAAQFIRAYAPRSKVQVMPNSIAIKRALPPVRPQVKNILFFGRLYPHKGIYDFLQAIPAVLEHCPDLRFLIAGNGETEKVKNLITQLGIEKSVSMLGWVDGADKERVLYEADILVQPSHLEAFGLSLLEAIAHGAAVVASNVGGIPSVIQDGKTGLLVPAGNTKALANTIIKLVQDDSLRHNLRQAAYADLTERFSSEVVIKKMNAIYSNICRSGY